MDNPSYHLLVDVRQQGTILLELSNAQGVVVGSQVVIQEGRVDNLLLTSVDKLLNSLTIDQSALRTVSAGSGIDKNSSLYRIVTSFGSAVSVGRALPGAGR